MHIDPVTLQVLSHSLQSIADEMIATLVRTAYSTNIKDRRDCSGGIYLPDGTLVSQAAVGTPLHLGVLPYAVQTVLEAIPVDQMEEGDDIICNRPYPAGPGHLNDVTIVSPVFFEGEVVALVANTAHHVDVGGGAPGSMPFGVTEIYQEGLQIPPLKIVRRGKLAADLLALINTNVRTRGEFKGDLLAQVAANNVAERRLQRLFRRYGLAESLAYCEEILNYSERRTRAALQKLPRGTWEWEDFLEGDGISERLIRIHVRLTIDGESITADLSGTDDQVDGPLNCRPPSVIACVYYVVKCVCDPGLPPNAGAYRPIRVITRPGSMFEARYPAAVCNANILTTQRIVDVLLGSLSQAVPERVTAACSGTMNLFNIGGRDPRTGGLYNYIETYGGGQGASLGRDGMSGVHTHMTNTRNASVEQIEIAYPIRVDRYGLVEDSDGAGEWRGGFGMVRELVVESEGTTMTLSSDRHRLGPWGLFGGGSGRPGECILQYPDGRQERLPSKVTRSIPAGVKIINRTPGGGGWGDPARRNRALVAKDVAEGLVSPERARSVYHMEGSGGEA